MLSEENCTHEQAMFDRNLRKFCAAELVDRLPKIYTDFVFKNMTTLIGEKQNILSNPN